MIFTFCVQDICMGHAVNIVSGNFGMVTSKQTFGMQPLITHCVRIIYKTTPNPLHLFRSCIGGMTAATNSAVALIAYNVSDSFNRLASFVWDTAPVRARGASMVFSECSCGVTSICNFHK